MADFLQFATAPPGTDIDLARMFLIPLDPISGERLVGPSGGIPGFQPEDLPTIQLQYWPETVTYSRGEIGWQQRNVPGLSHSLFQWTGNGSPSLTFESVFTSDHDPAYQPSGSVLPDSSDQGTIRDLDLNEVSAWFTAATNPLYAEGPAPDIPVNPPPVIQVVPESRVPQVAELEGFQSLNFGPAVTSFETRGAGTDFPDAGVASANDVGTTFSQIDRDFFGIIKDYGVAYEKWWPSGAPRVIRCSLTFLEVIQLGGEILPHSRDRNIRVFKTYRLIGNR